MDENFNETFEELFGEDVEPDPTWRATIRRGRLMLTNWAPWLITSGPPSNLLPARARAGVTIADLTIHGAENDEVSVRYVVRAENDHADEVLLDWAQRVGHKRVWLPDHMVELDPDPELIVPMTVRCDVCRARWSDGTPEFWLVVREGKAFPKWCPICGCELAQWTSPRERAPAPSRGGKGTRWASSDSTPRQRQETS